MPRMPGSQTIDNNIPPINEKSDFGHIFDSARMITADGQYTINFELDGMIIDRDARKISESKDGQSYELNI